MSESRAALPPVLDRPIRLASVPSYLWDVFEHLPVPLALEAELPEEPAAISLAARQLLKLSLSASALRLERLSLHTEGTARLRVRQGPRQCLLEAHELSQGITGVRVPDDRAADRGHRPARLRHALPAARPGDRPGGAGRGGTGVRCAGAAALHARAAGA